MRHFMDDGTGSPAAGETPFTFSTKDWEAIKDRLFRHRHTLGLRTVYIADESNTDRRLDWTTRIINVVIGIPVTIGIVLMFAVLITACILPWVM